MSVIKDIGMREPYAGQIELVTGEIADDLTYYFAQSEQTPSAVGLGVLVETDTSIRRAGGFIIQLLPDATDEMIEKLEKKLATLPYVSDLLDMGKTPEDILQMILGEMELKIMDTVPTEILLQLHTRACGKGTYQYWQRGTGKKSSERTRKQTCTVISAARNTILRKKN